MTSPDASVTHRINAERLVILGWGRAILLQLAHPLIAAGVSDHSAIGSDPRAAAIRLRRTIRAMLSLTFGGERAYEDAIAAIRAVHNRVNGQLGETVGPYSAGTCYSAHDADLLLWVHSTLIESIVLVYDDLVSPLDETARDDYCMQARRVALALGARDQDVPHTWTELVSLLEATRRSGAIVVGPPAKRLAGAVLAPPLASLVWPVVWMNRTMTVGMLPGDVRAQYGFPWTARHARRLERTKRMLRAARRCTPRRVAWWAVARQ